MAGSDSAIYERFLARTTVWIVIFGTLGAALFADLRGWRFGLGFFFGAGLSYLSFWRWQRIVEAIGDGPKPRSTGPMILRFLLLGLAAYAIVKFLAVNPMAVLFGLLVAAAAVLVASIIELFYART